MIIVNFPFVLTGFVYELSVAFHSGENFFTASVVSPPAELPPATINAAVAKHPGHIMTSFFDLDMPNF
jgi:hypothetical protein